MFPLKHKSDVHQHIVDFIAYAHTQFSFPVKCFQADNGTEFVNRAMHASILANGIVFHLSCPYTSPQNGKAERILRTLNNSVRTLLIHASMPPSYWAEALAAATYLLNRRPSSSIRNAIPYFHLYNSYPTYDHLRVFSCLCYPNLQATSPHKLAPRSTACVFLGYPPDHKGYCCLDLSTRRIIISRHVVFDESVFPFAREATHSPPSFDFLLGDDLVIAPYSTNRAADGPSAAAPSISNVEQPLCLPGGSGSASSTSGGRGLVPPFGPSVPPDAPPGGRGPVPPPGPSASKPAPVPALASTAAMLGRSAVAPVGLASSHNQQQHLADHPAGLAIALVLLTGLEGSMLPRLILLAVSVGSTSDDQPLLHRLVVAFLSLLHRSIRAITLVLFGRGLPEPPFESFHLSIHLAVR